MATTQALEVDAGDYFFHPDVLTVTVGATVRWNHVGSTGHDVTAVDGSWGTALIPVAGYFEHTFTREGVYDYICALHPPGMRGRIVVILK
jgi:plastocyanin